MPRNAPFEDGPSPRIASTAQGLIEPTSSSDKYRVSGIINKLDDTTLEVVELPIRTWTQTYKEMLEAMMESTEKAPAFIKVRAA